MKKALLVIDVQNDYLWPQRKAQFSYDTDALLERINRTIDEYHATDVPVIYIAHIVQNTWANRKLFGFSIAGSEGAKLYSGLHVVSEHYFEKLLGDAFTAKEFAAFIKEQQFDTLAICGLDEAGCVAATAAGARKRGITVELLSDCTASCMAAAKVTKKRQKLKALGVIYK